MTDLFTSLQNNIQANQGSLQLADPALGVENLSWLLDTLVKGASFQLDSAVLSKDPLVTVKGVCTLWGVHFDVTAEFSALTNSVGVTFNGEMAKADRVDLSKVVTHFFPNVDSPAIVLSTIQLDVNTSAKTFSLTLGMGEPGQSIPVGATGIAIQSLSGTISYADGIQAEVGIQVTIGSVSVRLKYAPPTDVDLTATIPKIPLGELMNGFAASAFDFPDGFPTIDLTDTKITISKASGNYKLAAITTVNGWGELALVVNKKSEWQVIVGIALVGSFNLGQISSAFNTLPLHGATLEPSALTLSSAKTGNPFEKSPLKDVTIVKGIAFFGRLDVSAATADLAKALSFMDAAPRVLTLQGAIAQPLANSYIEAQLGGKVTIPNTNFVLSAPSLRLTLAPSVQVRGGIDIPLDKANTQIVKLEGGLAVSTNEANLFVTQQFPAVNNPVGFSGVTLQNIGGALKVVFAPPGVGLTLQGAFLIGKQASGNEFAFSFDYVPPTTVNPRLLSCAFEELDLVSMSAALVPNVQVPPELGSVAFHNFSIYWCDAPTLLPDGTQAQPGIGFNAEMRFFGWTAYAMLSAMTGSGFAGKADLSPISLGGGAFTFTGNGQGGKGVLPGGATLTVSTTSSPYFALSANANLLGMTGQASGTIDNNGITFQFGVDTGGVYNYLRSNVSGTLSSNLADPNLAFAAQMAFRLSFVSRRMLFPGTNYYLGALHVDADFTGSFATSLKGTTFSLDASGSFSFEGQTWNYVLPNLRDQPSNLGGLPGNIQEGIKNIVDVFFNPLWSTAEQYIRLVASQILTETDPDIMGVLTSFYHLSTTQAINLLAQVKGKVPHVDLKQHLDTTSPHVDTRQHVDTPSAHVDTRSFFGHVDQGAPHLDQGTHIDQRPHVDSPLGTHIDI